MLGLAIVRVIVQFRIGFWCECCVLYNGQMLAPHMRCTLNFSLLTVTFFKMKNPLKKLSSCFYLNDVSVMSTLLNFQFVSKFFIAGLQIFILCGFNSSAIAAKRAVHEPLDGPSSVSVVTVSTGDITLIQNGLGTVNPSSSALVRTRVSGLLIKLHYTEGQLVKAGDLLAEVDPKPFQIALEQADGQLARDNALLQNAKIDLERYQTLWTQNSIAKQTLDGQAALVRQYEGLVSADKGNLDNAKLQLQFASITAPISGRVGLKQVDAGNLVSPTDANGIVYIAQIKPIDVIFSVPEDSVPKIAEKLNNHETLFAEAYDKSQRQLLAKGELITLDNQIDSTTGTIKLKARFKNENESLFPSQFVNVRLILESRKNVLLLPSAAIQHDLNREYVFTVDADKTVHQQAVKLGVSNAVNVEIVSGVSSGDKVVLEGSDRIHTGSKVLAIDFSESKKQVDSEKYNDSATE